MNSLGEPSSVPSKLSFWPAAVPMAASSPSHQYVTHSSLMVLTKWCFLFENRAYETSSLLLGSRGSSSHALPQPSAGQPVHGLQEGVPESQAGLAAEQPCLTGLCLLCCAPSRAGARARAGAGQVSCRGCLQPASSPGRGWRLPLCHALQGWGSGLRVHP